MFFLRNRNSYRLTEPAATFSLNNAQLVVGYLEDASGNLAKGVDLVFASQKPARFGPRGTYSYIFGHQEAVGLLDFIDKVLRNQLPAHYRFEGDVSGRIFSAGDCEWVITKFKKDWHDGGGYKGRIDNSWSYTITKSAMEDLRECVANFFDIS